MTGNVTRRILASGLWVLALPGSLHAHGTGLWGMFAHLHPHGVEILVGAAAIGLGAMLLARRRSW